MRKTTVHAVLVACLWQAACISRTADRLIESDGDNVADFDGGSDDGGSDDGGDGDQDTGPILCDTGLDCAALTCQTATTCILDGDGLPSCGYQLQADETECDLPGSSAGSQDGVCSSGSCVEPGPETCESNDACTDTAQTCLGGFCTALSAGGGTCDAGDDSLGDDADCVSGYICDSGSLTCIGENGADCVSDIYCLGRCIAGVCADPSDITGPCDSGQKDDCQGELVCHTDNTCRIGDGYVCAANNECTNVCVLGVCRTPVGAGELCDPGDHDDCSNTDCPYGMCGTQVYGETFVVEVRGYYASNAAVIGELEFYDPLDALIPLRTSDSDVYDSAQDGLPNYWLGGSWGPSKLFDGTTTYTDSASGAASSLGLLHVDSGSNPGPDLWARFAVFTDTPATITKMRMALGNYARRIPYEVNIYLAPNYDFDTHILERSNAGLTEVWTILPEDTAEWQVVRWEEVTF